MDNAAAGVLPLLWVEGSAVMIFVEVEVELVGLSALMGLANAHAQLRWLRDPGFLVHPPPAPAAAAPSAAESQ
jgi:hypothetical protein